MEFFCNQNQRKHVIKSLPNISTIPPEELYLSLQAEENIFGTAENSTCISKIKINETFLEKEIEYYDLNDSENNIETKSTSQITHKIVKKPKNGNKKYLGKNFPIIFGNSIVKILMLKCNCISKDVFDTIFNRIFLDSDYKPKYDDFLSYINEENYAIKFRNIKFFKEVWLNDDSNDNITIKNYKKFIREICQYFLENVAFFYFTSNFYTKQLMQERIIEYLKFIPVFLRGTYLPEDFNSLK